MNFGKALSFVSPAMGMATGQGIGKLMPFISPGYGMISGKGPFDEEMLKRLLMGLGGQKGGMFGSQMPMMGMFPGMMGDGQ